MFPNDEEVTLKEGKIKKYKFLNYHHAKRPTIHKSVWTASPQIEIKLFKETIDNNYLEDNTGFNVETSNSELQTLGKDTSPQRLVLAKYKIANESHGYPVNHMGGQEDRPNDEILEKLAKEKEISRCDKRRLQQGKPL